MSTQEMIDAQLDRIAALRKQFENPKVTSEDVTLAETLRTERAQTLRKTLGSLERQKSETVARFDTEIASVKDRIAALEKPGDLDMARQISGRAKPRRASPAPSTKTKPRANPARKTKK